MSSDEQEGYEQEHGGLLDSLGVTTVDASKVEQSVLARVSQLMKMASTIFGVRNDASFASSCILAVPNDAIKAK